MRGRAIETSLRRSPWFALFVLTSTFSTGFADRQMINLICWASYLGPLANAGDVPIYAAPARSDDLSDLPPTFIGTGALDLFVDENIDYAQRLLAANVSTELLVYPRAIHGFDLFLPEADISKRFVADRIAALRRAFAG
ncbi:MAG: arylesterase [Alphaproteobacteria bacterium]|nr:arylesterase [Alphaproteobacteria bacterium]